MSAAEEFQEQGIKLYSAQDFEGATRLFQQALEAYQSEDRPDMVAEMQTNIGLTHRALGEYQQALDVMQKALHTFQEMGDQCRAAQVIGNIGGVYRALDDKEQAYNCYRQAADIFLAIGQDKLYGETIIALAKMQVRDGKIWTVAAMYEVGLEHIDNLSTSQKILKKVIALRRRIIGG